MASIKKLNNGSYQATVSCGRDANGKQIRKYVTKSAKKECISAARKIEQDYEDGKIDSYNNINCSDWIDDWFELNKTRLRPSTLVSYKQYAKVHFKPYFKKYKLSQVTRMHVMQYLKEKLGVLSSNTVRKHFFILRNIFDDALKDKNPFADIDPPDSKKFKPHIVTDKEFETIHQIFKGHRYEAIILLSGWCGMRRGEIFALKWDDIDWENNRIRVDESRAISEYGYEDGDTKSDNGLRIVAIPKKLIQLLDKKRSSQKVITERVFKGRLDDFSHRFKEQILKYNLPKDIRFHDLRHYHANFLRKNNVPDVYAASRLGHDIQTLKQIYHHIDDGERKETDKNIINLIENPGT